jgi:hypothetical protein
VVKLRIEQRVSLTRTVFEATLVLDNDASEALSGVAVNITLLDAARRPVSLAVFNVTRRAAPLLDVAGASLAPGAEAELVWLLAPNDAAAPRDETAYFVTGSLAYRVGDASPATAIELLPERILVQPNPRLRFDYFLERRVVSDDPFTEDVVEPAVPFALGLLVSNDGYGRARDMRVASSQPTIVENAKGLLVDFQILEARVNDAPAQLSLLAELGDIGALASASAVWSMRASLQGEFTAFNATFRHVSTRDNGAQMTNLVRAVVTHRLTRAVTMPSTRRVAFLADDVWDAAALPDTLHAGRLSEPVASALAINGTVFDAATRRLTVAPAAVALLVAQNARFYHVRIADPLADDVALLGAESVLSNASAIDVWREHYTERVVGRAPERIRWLNLFANKSDGFAWLLRTAPLAKRQVRVENVTATSAVVVWDAAQAADVDLVVGNLSVRWSGSRAPRFVVSDLTPDTEYNATVTPTMGAALGAATSVRFRTQANATAAAAAASLFACGGTATCENDARIGAACSCVCRRGFSGARCDVCAPACGANGRAGVLGGACACACAPGWSGERCDELLVGADGCARATLASAQVQICFRLPPPSVRIVQRPAVNSGAVLAFNVSAAFVDVDATLTARNLGGGAEPELEFVRADDSVWVDAASSCASPARQMFGADGTLVAAICKLGSFEIVPKREAVGSTTTSTLAEITSLLAGNDTTTTLVANNTGIATMPPRSNGGLIGGLIAAALLLLCSIGAGVFFFLRRKKQQQQQQQQETELSETVALKK